MMGYVEQKTLQNAIQVYAKMVLFWEALWKAPSIVDPPEEIQIVGVGDANSGVEPRPYSGPPLLNGK
jgi:hypothetical protein